MTRRLMMWTVFLTAAGMSGTVARAQQPTGPPQPASVSKPAMVPLEVEVVLARYQGDKKISSIPYTLNVTANGDQTTLNMGTEVPVATSTFVPANQTGSQPAPLRSYNYRPIGSNFILRATTVTDNLYQIQLNVEDSSVFTPEWLGWQTGSVNTDGSTNTFLRDLVASSLTQ